MLLSWLYRLSKTDFPVRLLPRVAEGGTSAGVLARCWHGIAAGTPVTAAMGDLQCYMLATLRSDKDAGLLSDKCLLYVWVSCLLTFHNYGLIIQGGPKN